jgi:hypothetical protein
MQSIAAYFLAQALPEPGSRRSRPHGPSLITRARRSFWRVVSPASAEVEAGSWLGDVVPPLTGYPTTR